MKIFFGGLIISLASFAFQILFWRIYLLRNKSHVVLHIFGIGLMAGLSILILFPKFLVSLGFSRLSVLEIFHLTLFYGAVTFAYYMFYLGIIDTSPTLAIIRMLLDAGEKGLALSEFTTFFSDQLLILPRLDYLVQTEMVTKKENRYVIAPNGTKFLFWFVRFPQMIFPVNNTRMVG